VQGRKTLELLTATNTQLIPISEEQLKAFIAKVQGDKSLQDQLKAEGADAVAIAKAAGFSITTEDLN